MASYARNDSASNRSAMDLSASGSSSVSGMSRSSKRIEDAKNLSRATSRATLAAKTILSAGGTEDAALQTAKAAAQATLLQPHAGTPSLTGPSAYLSRRRIKRQSEVVASMALVSASNQLYSEVPYDPLTATDYSAIKKMRISVNQDAMMDAKNSPLSATPRVSLLPTILSSGNDAQDGPMCQVESKLSEGSESEKHTTETYASESEDEPCPTPKVSNAPAIDTQHSRSNDCTSNAENQEHDIEKTQETLSGDPDKDTEIPTSGSTSNEVTATKPLNRGSLSLDSGSLHSRDLKENLGFTKKKSESEAKENSPPKPIPSPIVIPSPKEANVSATVPDHDAKSPKTSTPSNVLSPANSVLANLLRKKSTKNNVLTPTGTYFTKEPELKGDPEKKHRASSLVISTPPVSPDRDVRINAGNTQPSDLDDDDASTLGNDPVYIVTNHGRNRERRRAREHAHSQQRYPLTDESSSASSSVDSSLFSLDTYRTNQTFMTTNADPFIFSVFSNMLRCGGGGGAPNAEVGSRTTARSNQSTKQFQPAKIVLTRATTARDDNKEFGAIVKGPHDPSYRNQSANNKSGGGNQGANNKRGSGRPKVNWKEPSKDSWNVISEGMKWMEQSGSKKSLRDEKVAKSDERAASVELVATNDASTESGAFESYSSHSGTEASLPEVADQRSKDSNKKLSWRKALGLKPGKPKTPKRNRSLQERTTIME